MVEGKRRREEKEIGGAKVEENGREGEEGAKNERKTRRWRVRG